MIAQLANTRVSVLTAVRNGIPHIREAIDSVLTQTMRSLELIVVDDGSTDSTSDLLEQLARHDNRLKILNNPVSLGLTRSLNLALKSSIGQYIARIDHDDIWLEGKLAKQIYYLDRNPYVALLGTSFSERVLGKVCPRKSILPNLESDIEIRKALYRLNPFLHSSIIFRRNVIDRIGGYNETYQYAQDYEMWTRILTCGLGHVIPEVLCVRRLCEKNISVRKERAQRFNALRAKLAWCRRNGFSWQVIIPAIRDLIIVIMPKSIKKLVRGRLHQPDSA